MCKPARLELPRCKMAVFAGRGRPDHRLRKRVATASSCCTKVSEKSREVNSSSSSSQARSQGVRKGGYILRGSGGAPPENF